MDSEKSITKLDNYVGQKVQVVAYGASYVGTLQKVDMDKGILILTDGKDKATIDLSRVESFASLEEEPTSS